MFVFVAFAIFSVALFAAGYYAWSVPEEKESQVLVGRLRELRARTATRTRGSGDLIRQEEKGKFAFLGEFVQWLGILRRLQETIDQANLKYRAVDVFGLTIILFAGMWVFLGLTGLTSFLLRLVMTGLVAMLPIFVISRIRERRLTRFEANFPDAIDLFNRSMKAGHTIHSGLETIAQETSDPVKMEFKKVIEELGLGSQVDAALLNLGKRVPLIDLKFFITGLLLQRQTGANMVEVLDNLSLLVRERLNMAAKMKAHTAQQRFSAGLLCALPVIMFLGLWLLKPEYANILLYDETGNMVFTYAIVSELIGIFVINKLANPKF